MEEDFLSPRNSTKIDPEDPCVAVSGYRPRDEERICKFFAKTGRCWKKHCIMEHIKIEPGDYYLFIFICLLKSI